MPAAGVKGAGAAVARPSPSYPPLPHTITMYVFTSFVINDSGHNGAQKRAQEVGAHLQGKLEVGVGVPKLPPEVGGGVIYPQDVGQTRLQVGGEREDGAGAPKMQTNEQTNEWTRWAGHGLWALLDGCVKRLAICSGCGVL